MRLPKLFSFILSVSVIALVLVGVLEVVSTKKPAEAA